MNKFKVGDYVEVTNPQKNVEKFKGQKGYVTEVTDTMCEVASVTGVGFYHSELSLAVKPSEDKERGKFQKIANEIGAFTDMKNMQYGSSVDATYEMMKVLMERYTYDEENYLMPKDLLPHMLLQVRSMDKINRIFNNPSGKGDSESPYKDLTGYGLIGADMVERLKTDNQ